MSYKFEEGKDSIINEVISLYPIKKDDIQHDIFEQFAQQILGTVSLEDLKEFSIENLYGAIVNFLSFVHEKNPRETKIRIYHPDVERHGWETTHSVIEVISDDMPFLVDSIQMVLKRMQIPIHLIMFMGGMRVERDSHGKIIKILHRHAHPSEVVTLEAPIFLEIERLENDDQLRLLQQNLESSLDDTHTVVNDWLEMREKVRELVAELDTPPKTLDADEVEETKTFLKWIEDHHFTFLGIRDYELVEKGKETILQAIPHTSLGVLKKEESKTLPRNVAVLAPEARELIMSSHILVMSKTNAESTVHRSAFTDYIGVKRFNKHGKVVGERRIVGLYTSAAYNTNPQHIPFLRHKVALLLKKSQLNPQGHSGKILLNIIETLPRDELIQGSEDELLEIVMGIYYMQERRRIHLFSRVDVYRRFVSCLVYVPKDIYNSDLRSSIQNIICSELQGEIIFFSTYFSESLLARIHFLVRTDPQRRTKYNFKDIENKIIEVSRSWKDDIQHLIIEGFGEAEGSRLFFKYKNAFHTEYIVNFTPRIAVIDIKHIERLSVNNSVEMSFFKPVDDVTGYYRLKIYRNQNTLPLSDVLPILENLGLRAITERPYVLNFADGNETWINDFTLQYTGCNEFDFDERQELFQNAFLRIWFEDVENDGFNKLVLGAGLNWRQVNIIRMYAKYFKQIGFTFSQEYIEDALNRNPIIAKNIINLFEMRFDPSKNGDREKKFATLSKEIMKSLENVANLDEDKIIRQYIHVISATTRTNFYQKLDVDTYKSYLAIKVNPTLIPGVPLPHPKYEIFVYSIEFEGVHLRCGKVARGGLRWSDRKEDFRTEILGLMKAQQVKNAVIVPCGAKGGFVPKRLMSDLNREEILTEGIRCYQQFIRGLLDITDNYVNSVIAKPESVICYDDDDPYLVVAADKGTATFSDFANEISKEYNFWLGDAFASGGSVGYDHKKMGITARGAWESVKRHFFELGINIELTDFSVVGIGDMAGDVFGNGMLLSKHIQLVAAFNHMHIFVDPNPIAIKSYEERKRLFELPRSSWSDYNPKLISAGGGVFSRHAKIISVSPEMQKRFDIEKSEVEPNELIKYILKANIDLLWSAGIGTFIKSITQSNVEVGDRTNDPIRINGIDLRCKAVGEGGNLGFTQLGRMEYAQNGGRIYTDFIDNSAGVSCSDKEVNIKILLNSIIESGDLTLKQRNKLLTSMTDEVAELVLRENYLQPRAISLVEYQSLGLIEMQGRYINELERMRKLDRDLEFLPSEKLLAESKLAGKGLISPCLSVLLCYSKIVLKEQLLCSNVPEEPFLKNLLITSFPTPLQKKYSKDMEKHPLRREIIATRICNLLVDEVGPTFVYRLQDETGALAPAVARAYMIARKVLNMEAIWEQIEALDNKIDTNHQHEMLMTYARLLRRVTRWFLQSNRTHIDMEEAIHTYSRGVDELSNAVPLILGEENQVHYEKEMENHQKKGTPALLAHQLTITRGLFAAMDIIEIANHLEVSILEIGRVYYGIGEYLDLNWIRSQVIVHKTENHWEALSREALRDDLDWQQRALTEAIVKRTSDGRDLMERFTLWSKDYQVLIERWRQILARLKSSTTLNFIMFFVAIRELLDLTQATMEESMVVEN